MNLLRIGAALLVVLGHARYLYFGSPVSFGQSSIGLQAFYCLTGLSHQAVVFFFVSSGFLVGGPIARLMNEHTFDVWTYLINRFSRIYIVFIPALALAFVLNWTGSVAFIGTSEHGDVLDGWSDFNLLCHLACLQRLSCVSHANPPLWSLGYEWLLYLAAPVCLCIVYASFDWTVRVIALTLFALILYAALPSRTEWQLLFAWFAGVASYRRLTLSSLPLSVGIVGVIAVSAACIVSRAQVIPIFATDIPIAIGLALAIGCRQLMALGSFNKISAKLASFSYSLYAIHLPIVVLCARALEWFGMVGPKPEISVRGGIAYVLSIAVAFVAAFCFAGVTEANTDALRRAILSRRTFRNRPPGRPPL